MISNQNGNKNQLNAVMVKNLKLEYERKKIHLFDADIYGYFDGKTTTTTTKYVKF